MVNIHNFINILINSIFSFQFKFKNLTVSVTAPTFITATPPDNLANLSCNLSFSYIESK